MRSLPVQLEQFAILLILFAAGKITAWVYLGWWQALGMIVFAFVVEHALIWIKRRKIEYVSFSALSTSLGIMVMLVASNIWIYGVVLVLALVQKHFLTIEKRHFFNPSNFALIVAILLFYDRAHLVMGQMGEALWLAVLMVMLALAILIRVDRWRIPAAFVVSYLLFQYLGVVGYDPMVVFENILERFVSVSFLMFVAFMLTDPRVTPSGVWYQVGFGVVVALLAVMMDRWFGFRVQHLFAVLFVLSPWVPLIEKGRSAPWILWAVTIALFCMAIGATFYIENQPPYYFEMSK